MRRLALALAFAVVASSPALGADKPAKPSVTNGKDVYDKWCASCHAAGIGNPGLDYKPAVDALRTIYPGSTGLLTDRTDLTPEVVELFVRNGASVMPFFRRSEITDSELRDMGEYLSQKNKNR